MQITIEVKDGATPEAIARALRFQANLMDGIEPKKAASNAMTAAPTAGKKKAKPADEDEEIEESEDEEIEDDDAEDADEDLESDDEESGDEDGDGDDSGDEETEDEDESEDDEEAEDEDEPAPKKGKGKAKPKLSTKEEKLLKEVNAALKARAKKTSFDKVKVWLKKKFKVESINHLKPSQFAAVIKASKAA